MALFENASSFLTSIIPGCGDMEFPVWGFSRVLGLVGME